MISGGNAECSAFFEQNGVPMSTPIKSKYHTKVAELYKQKLDAAAEGKDWKPPANMAELVKQKTQEMGGGLKTYNSPAKSEPRKAASKNDDWDDWGEEKTFSSNSKAKKVASPSTQSPQESLRNSGNTKSSQRSGLTSSGNSYSNGATYGNSSPAGNSYGNSYGNSSQSERLSKFDGQRAISSADFFGEDQPSKKSSGDDFFNSLGAGFSRLSTVAMEGAKTASEKLKQSTSEISKTVQEKGWSAEVSAVGNKLAETGGKGWSLAQDLWSKAKESLGEFSQQLNTEAQTSQHISQGGKYGGNDSGFNGGDYGNTSYNSQRGFGKSPSYTDGFDTHTDVASLDFDKPSEDLENWLNDEKPRKSKPKTSNKKNKEKVEDTFDDQDQPTPKNEKKATAEGWDDWDPTEQKKTATKKAPTVDDWDDWGETPQESTPVTAKGKKEPVEGWDKWDDEW
jgi:ADP-ribosylation factor GTPase-activating protein 1